MYTAVNRQTDGQTWLIFESHRLAVGVGPLLPGSGGVWWRETNCCAAGFLCTFELCLREVPSPAEHMPHEMMSAKFVLTDDGYGNDDDDDAEVRQPFAGRFSSYTTLVQRWHCG